MSSRARTGTDLRVGHCSNLACTSATFTRLPGSSLPPSSVAIAIPRWRVGSDGRPARRLRPRGGRRRPCVDFDVELRRCVDTACSALEPTFSTVAFRNEAPSIGMAPGDLPVVSNYGELTPPSPKLKVTRCTTPACPFEVPVVIDGPGVGPRPRDGGRRPGPGPRQLLRRPRTGPEGRLAGPPPEVSIGDVAVVEGTVGQTFALLSRSRSPGRRTRPSTSRRRPAPPPRRATTRRPRAP